MRKSLILLFLLAFLAIGIAFIAMARRAAFRAQNDAMEVVWPAGLGTLASVPERYPSRSASPAAIELLRLAGEAGIAVGGPSYELRAKISDYVGSQMQRTDPSIDPLPEEVKELLESMSGEIAALRSHLLDAGEIEWELDIARGARTPRPDLLLDTRIAKLLSANALHRAGSGDPAAWGDLHATWNLARPLWQHPEIISSLIAVAITRQIVVLSRQMPLPAPVWFEEVRTFDYRRQMAAAMQGDMWIVSKVVAEEHDAQPRPPGLRSLANALVLDSRERREMARYYDFRRERIAEILKMETCELVPTRLRNRSGSKLAEITAPNLDAAWKRVFRLRAEVELAEHALGLRSGPGSRCADGDWVAIDGGVKFSREIPIAGPPRAVVPLEFRRSRAIQPLQP